MEKLVLNDIKNIFDGIYDIMLENRDYLIELDSKAGDGDLGLSMCQGFGEIKNSIGSGKLNEENISKFLMRSSMILNEASPSSLGTILSVGLMAGARVLRGKEALATQEIADFVLAAVEGIMARAGSKRGEKTILDSLCAASDALNESATAGDNIKVAFQKAYEAAHEGMLATIEMQAVHGRAAYYQEKSIGNQDGGATVGMLLFKALREYTA